jgi:hypothetical protein
MASFIIHTIAGEKFLNLIEEEYNMSISDYDKKQFLLGNLIVDSINTPKYIPDNIKDKTTYKMEIKNKIRKEKLITHFRDPIKEGECIKSPDPNKFIKKYNELIKENYSALGYLFHLYTDKMFFCNLFTETFDTLDKNGNLTKEDNTLEYIRIRKNGILVNAKEFWAGTSKTNIYNDYTIINKIILEHFGITIDIKEFQEFAMFNFENPGIEEVYFQNITNILNEMEKYIEESYEQENRNLSIFSYEKIIGFIDYVIIEFIKEYKILLNEIMLKERNIK